MMQGAGRKRSHGSRGSNRVPSQLADLIVPGVVSSGESASARWANPKRLLM
jgi:hypothetical protein